MDIPYMTFDQFKYLSENDQEYLLWKTGVELARRKDEPYHYILYQVEGFYMEVKYIMPQRTLIHIACFDDVGLIDPYLQSIDIYSMIGA